MLLRFLTASAESSSCLFLFIRLDGQASFHPATQKIGYVKFRFSLSSSNQDGSGCNLVSNRRACFVGLVGTSAGKSAFRVLG